MTDEVLTQEQVAEIESLLSMGEVLSWEQAIAFVASHEALRAQLAARVAREAALVEALKLTAPFFWHEDECPFRACAPMSDDHDCASDGFVPAGPCNCDYAAKEARLADLLTSQPAREAT